MTDDEIIIGLSQRSQAATTFLYKEYKPYLMDLLHRKKKVSLPAAEDIFQEAVFSELKKRPTLPLNLHSATYKTYFKVICLNLYKNYCRANKRRAKVTLEELTLPGEEAVIEKELERVTFRKIIQQGIKGLLPECRSIVLAQLVFDKTTAEIAKKLGIKDATARKRASRCRQRLRELITQDPRYQEMKSN